MIATTKSAKVPMIAYDSKYAFANQNAFQRIIKLLEFVTIYATEQAAINNLEMTYGREY